jgi:ElaA protein
MGSSGSAGVKSGMKEQKQDLMPCHWMCLPLLSHGVLQWHRIMECRMAVFVVEQQCPYQDADELDEHSLHLSAWANPPSFTCDTPACWPQPLAYARLIPPGVKHAQASMGRVLTHPGYRGRGLGRLLLQKALEAHCQHHAGYGLKISAQTHLLPFYAQQGFQAEGPAYLEDGISHTAMVWTQA